ncbi:MAG: glycoside hydrolase [Verrucomicrobia bacterium]|nr:glycoside hydrolase [Verrucomicrobiota bacterium]
MSSSTPRKRTVHYTLSTHWDREWREPFQGIRYALVTLMDRVIAGLEDGRLRGPFQTDGQSILVEDYLEIRPERRAQVERLAREGKLVIGPWYSMPDEFTVSGEALIRNLIVGRQDARDLGGIPSKAGYVPDMFGHISQLPQIFALCGVPVGYVWRGVNNTRERTFIWRGADGTEMPCHKFGNVGYGTFAHQVNRGHEYNGNIEERPAELTKLAREYLDREAAATAVDDILLHDACDHQEWSPQRYALLFADFDRSRKYDVVHTSLDVYLERLIAQRGKIRTVLTGELRAAGRAWPEADHTTACNQWVIPGVLSSRVRLKQANAVCQGLLCQWAEPFTAYAQAAVGADFAPGFLTAAWRSLMKNHAHDSIDGCSPDQVHKDMEYRFDQCRLIADKLAVDATSRIAASVAGAVGDHELRVTVFNALPRDFNGPGEITLEIPTTWPTFNEFFGFEPKTGFVIHDARGKELPYQRLGQALNRVRQRIRPTKFPEGVMSHHIPVALDLSIPACGYTTLTVKAVAAGRPTRYPEVPAMATSERSMANEHLDVVIEANGSLTLTDKQNGRVYSRLLTFEDCADIGDGWYHGIAVNDQVFASTAARSEVALVHNGPLLTTFRIRTTMQVPAEFKSDGMVRSEMFVPMVIDSFVSLRPGQRHLDIRTNVDNTADDHRLRVLFPSGAKAGTYLTDTAFDIVERPIALPRDNHEYRELNVETQPQQSWTAVHDAKGGLAVVTDALLESAVRDLPERPVALTLFRGTRRTVFTEGEPNGQMRGALQFRYFVLPLSGAPDRTSLCELGQQIAAGRRVVQLRTADLEIYRTGHALPASAGFFRVEGPAVVSSTRQVGAAVEIRLWNPLAKATGSTVILGEALRPAGAGLTATHVDFEGNVLRALRVAGDSVKVSLRAKEIVTIRIEGGRGP